MKYIKLIFVFLIVLGQPSLCAAQEGESLEGRWYGQSWSWEGRVQHDFLKLWIAEHLQDGVFEVSFYKCDQEGLEFVVAYSGTWELTNGYLSTIYDQKYKDGEAIAMAPSHNLYKVEKLTRDIFAYKHVDSGMPYQSKRVEKDKEALCQSLLM